MISTRGRSFTLLPSTENSLFVVWRVVSFEKRCMVPTFITPARPRFGDWKVLSDVLFIFCTSWA